MNGKINIYTYIVMFDKFDHCWFVVVKKSPVKFTFVVFVNVIDKLVICWKTVVDFSCKRLVLVPIVNATNILWAAFCANILLPKNYREKLRKILLYARKMLMKLTPGWIGSLHSKASVHNIFEVPKMRMKKKITRILKCSILSVFGVQNNLNHYCLIWWSMFSQRSRTRHD